MPQFNAVYFRELTLFDERKLRVTKKEIIIQAKSIVKALELARKTRPKGFIVHGIETISLIILLLLSSCVTIKQWRHPEAKKIEYTNPAKFF